MQPVETAAPDRSRGPLFASPDRVDLDAIAQHFVKLAGGAGSIAKMLYDEYTAAGEGSPVRARIMEMMLRAFTKLDAKTVPDDLRDISDEDLERVLDTTAARVGRSHGHQRPSAAAEEEIKQQEVKQAGEAEARVRIGAAARNDSTGAGSPANPSAQG